MPTMMERLALRGELWDSLPDEVNTADVLDWHREEVDRLRGDLDANPGVGRPWREVLTPLS